jgi:sortase A
MNSRVSSSWSISIVCLAVIVSASTLVLSIFSVSRPTSLYAVVIPAVGFIQNASSSEENIGIPIRLTIPDIHVDASVEDLGLTPLDAMAVPEGPIDVAWYDLGPRPGDLGSAVIAGHEGWKDGIAAVFDNLSKLSVGDEIYVKDNTGTTTAFIVRKVEIYGKNDSASTVFDSNDGTAHLNLITCEGVWNAATQSYSGRLVVFADKE